MAKQTATPCLPLAVFRESVDGAQSIERRHREVDAIMQYDFKIHIISGP